MSERRQPREIIARAIWDYGSEPGEQSFDLRQPAERQFGMNQALYALDALADAGYAVVDARPHGEACEQVAP